LRVEWRLQGKFVIGYSGNLGRAHEFKTILDAAQVLRDRPDIAFLFIGAGHQLAMIEAEAQKRGLTNISIRPFQPTWRLKQSLSVPDVHLVSLQAALEGLVVPSKFYGIAAVGRPTIFVGDPSGEIPAILAEAGCGAIAPIGDIDHLDPIDAAERQQLPQIGNGRGRAIIAEAMAEEPGRFDRSRDAGSFRNSRTPWLTQRPGGLSPLREARLPGRPLGLLLRRSRRGSCRR
jgi:glycosyltransferase involved in cell wall biosynthesis